MPKGAHRTPLKADASQAIGRAQRVAADAGHAEVTPQDLLWSLQADPSLLSAILLQSVGWPSDGDDVRDGLSVDSERYIPLSAAVKQAAEAAYGAARTSGHLYVGSEHLLLGLARQPGSVLGERFARYGVTVDGLAETAETLGEWQEGPRYSPASQDVIWAVEDEALAAGRDLTLVADLVIVLASCSADGVAAIFSNCGLSTDMLRSGLAEHVPPTTKTVKHVKWGNVFKRSLYLATECAHDLGLERVGPQQLLLGALGLQHHWVEPTLVRAGTSGASLRLQSPDIEPGSIRAHTPFWEAFGPDSHQVLLQAARSAKAAGAVEVGTSDVVVAALAAVPDRLTQQLTDLGVRKDDRVLEAARSAGRDECLPFSSDLGEGLNRALAAWRERGIWRASPTQLLLGLLSNDDDYLRDWLKRHGVARLDAFRTVLRYALFQSWTDPAQRVWRKADAAARQRGATELGLPYVLRALVAEPAFKEQGVLEAHGVTDARVDEYLADWEAAQPVSGDSDQADDARLLLDDECQQLCTAAIEAAVEATHLRVDVSDLVRALASEDLATLTQLQVDRQAFAEHLQAPESLWEAHAALAARTREVAELRALHGPNHIATVSANDKRLAAMLELGLWPDGGQSDPKMLWRLNRAMWSHGFRAWRAALRHRGRGLWQPTWMSLASRREFGDVLRGFFLWKKLQYEGAYDRDSSGRQGLGEFDALLVRYDTAVAEAEADGTDWELAVALLNRADVLDAVGRFPEARADRARVQTVIAEDDDTSSHLWMRSQTSLPQVHHELDSGPEPMSRADRRELRVLVVGVRVKTFLDFWFPWASTGDWRLHDSLHSVGLLLPRAEIAAMFMRAGATRNATRELRRIVRARRRFHRSRHPQTLSAEVILAHGLVVAARQPQISSARRRWRAGRAWRSIRRTREVHVVWLGPGHPLTLATQVLAVDGLLVRGRAADAMATAVEAIAAADAARYRFDDTRTREGWRNIYAGLMRRALELAREHGEDHLIVELIEAARGQGAPIAAAMHAYQEPEQARARYASTSSRSHDRRELSAGLALIADVPIAPIGHVSVAGGPPRLESIRVGDLDRSERSAEKEALAALIEDALDDADQTADAPSPVNVLALARTVTGHPEPWVWGSWDIDGSVVSYLVRPNTDGDTAFSIETFTEPRSTEGHPTALGAALDAFGEAMITNDEQSRRAGVDDFVARSDLTRWVGSERRLLLDLGLSLIPQPLRREAARRAEHGEDPIPLVVMPAPSCASLPLAALAVAPPSDGAPSMDGPRLVEGARIFLVPGPQFATAARRRHEGRWVTSRPSTSQPIAAAVVADQPGMGHELRYAHASVPKAAATLCSGPNATLRDTIDALSTREPGRPGLLQFSGHAHAGAIGLPADAHLVLHRGFDDPGQRLYARDLIRGRFPNLSIPRTVVLSACSTWGDDGAADWLGLAPGFIWCGAQHVVATLWPILDLKEVAADDAALVDRLVSDARSPVDVVRDFQLEALHRQRAVPWLDEASATGWVEAQDLGEQACSYLWAPFTVITVAATAPSRLSER